MVYYDNVSSYIFLYSSNGVFMRSMHYILPQWLALMQPVLALRALKAHSPFGYPFTLPGSREMIVEKMPCLYIFFL